MTRRAAGTWVFLAILLAACGGTGDGPAPLDTKNETCAWCRMGVSDLRFAAQLTAPGQEPKFFDDAGCLRNWLKAPREAGPWTAWFADHRTKQWAKGTTAVFTRNPAVQTPMNSGIFVHADAGSRNQDPASKGGTFVAPADVLGPFPSVPK